MSKLSRFKKYLSDRSGFDYFEQELTRDEGHLVGPDEHDTPPPSDIPLGGEGDISSGELRSNSTSYDVVVDYPVHYLTASSTCPIDNSSDAANEPKNGRPIYISGSNNNISLISNPQVASSIQGDIIALYSVGSSVTLSDGNGLSLRKSFVMDSGAILNLFYSGTDNLWHECSRSHVTKNLGEL